MQRGEAKAILGYYKAIPGMLKDYRRQKTEIEDEYYNTLCSIVADGMPHGASPGRPTEAAALLAAENDALSRLRELETLIGVLEGDQALIRGSLDVLNGRYKTIIVNRYLREYSWTKIAFRMNSRNSTVRFWHEKALDRLKDALEELPMADEIAARASRARL